MHPRNAPVERVFRGTWPVSEPSPERKYSPLTALIRSLGTRADGRPSGASLGTRAGSYRSRAELVDYPPEPWREHEVEHVLLLREERERAAARVGDERLGLGAGEAPLAQHGARYVDRPAKPVGAGLLLGHRRGIHHDPQCIAAIVSSFSRWPSRQNRRASRARSPSRPPRRNRDSSQPQ